MKFSSLTVPINDKIKGILRLNIQKKNNTLNLLVEFYKIKFNMDNPKLRESIMDTIIEKCYRDPTEVDGLDSSIHLELVLSNTYNYTDLENISQRLNCISGLEDLNSKIKFPIGIFGASAIFTAREILRIKRFISSFLYNFNIIKDVLSYINTIKVEQVQENDQSLFSKEVSVENSIKTEEVPVGTPPIIHQILNFLEIDQQVIGYLVDLIINYYSNYSDSSVVVDENKLKITSTNLFPPSISYNKAFLLTLLESMNKTSVDQANLIVKNLFKFIQDHSSELSTVHIKSVMFILMLYCLRHLSDTFKSWIVNNIDNIVYDTITQEKILNTYCDKILGKGIISFSIKQINVFDGAAPDINQEVIKEISAKYSYVRPIDQEKFADLVFQDFKGTDKTPSVDIPINIGFKHILNVDNLLKFKQTDTPLISVSLPRAKNLLINYKKSTKDPKVISETFGHFLNFIGNSVYLTTLSKEKLSSPIVKSFEVLKEVLNDINFKKENINTYSYYLTLKKYFPKDFNFANYLTIIFQIIIPYYYYYFNTVCFEDTFLGIVGI